ncbi:MAG: hypothetical protein LYZ69_07125 [Nitrososphaerales archaeon]|nr:hypothetical protein [Nitrososphaerales archaeon]
MAAARQSGTLADWFEGLGRVRTRPVVVLKQGVARCDGQLINPKDGVVLAPDQAYETVCVPVEEESLGSVAGVDTRVTPF